MLPPSGSKNPAMRFKVVVLPQPEGPSTDVISPSRNSIDMSSTAATLSNRLRRPSTRTLGIPPSLCVVGDRDRPPFGLLYFSAARAAPQHLDAELERPTAVLARDPFGRIAIAPLDRRHQGLCIGYDFLGASRAGQRRAGELADLLLQMLEQPIDRLITGGTEDRQLELPRELPQLLDVGGRARRLHLFVNRTQLGELDLTCILRRQARRHAFQRFARIVDLEQLLLIDGFYRQRVAGLQRDQILGLKLAQRLAHGRLADAELPGELVRAQPCSGLEHIGNYSFAQHRIGGLGCVADVRETIDE